MADSERLIISRILYYPEEFVELAAAGVGRNHFHDEEHGAVWDWLSGFYEKYGKVPGREALRMAFPTYRLHKVPEPLDHYIDLLNSEHRRYMTLSMVSEANLRIADGDIEGVRTHLSQNLLWLEQDTYITNDEDLNKTWADRLAEYQAIVEQGTELRGMPTGFPTFDLITGGFQPEQFVVLIGPAKAGKSAILLRSAWAANQAGYKVLFIGFEMSNVEQAARFDGMRGGFNYNILLHGRMGRKEKMALEAAGKEYEHLAPMVFIHDMSRATTLTAVAAKIAEHKPDLVMIDGVYMMDSEIEGVDPMDTRSLTRISRGLKRMAQVRKIPIVVSTQALDHKWNRKEGLTSRSAGYTSAFSQDCDFMFGIEAPEEEGDTAAKMRLILGRTAPRKVIMVEFDWENGRIEEQKMWSGGDDEDDMYGGGFAESA